MPLTQATTSDNSSRPMRDRVYGPRCIVVVVCLIISALASWNLQYTSYDDDPFGLFRQSRARSLYPENISTNTCLVFLHRDSWLSQTSLRELQAVHVAMQKVRGVERVYSLLSLRRKRRVGRYLLPLFSPDSNVRRFQHAVDEAKTHPMVRDVFLTHDARTTVLFADIASTATSTRELRQVLDELRHAILSQLQSNVTTVHITGVPVIRVGVTDAIVRDQIVFNLCGISAACLLSLILLRTVSAAGIIVLGPAMAVLWTLGGLAAFGEKLNALNGVVAPLIFSTGMAQAIHFVSGFRQVARPGLTPTQCAWESFTTVAPACALASATTAVGFGSLVLSEVEVIQRFGVTCSVAVLVTFIAVAITVPLLCSTGAATIPSARRKRRSRFLYLERAIIRHSIPVTLVGIVICTVASVLAMQLRVDMSLSDAISTRGEIAESVKVANTFGGILPVTVVVEWPEGAPAQQVINATEHVVSILDREPYLGKPISIVQLVSSLPGRSTAEQLRELRYVPAEFRNLFVDARRRRAYVRVMARDVGSAAIGPMLRRIDSELQQIANCHSGFRFHIAPSLVSDASTSNIMMHSLHRSLMLAVPVTAFFLAIAFRSVRLAVISLPPNILPLAAVAASMVIVGLPLQLGTITVFSILFGVSVDDSIHIIFRFRLVNRRPMTSGCAAYIALRSVGPAVAVTSVILVAGLSVIVASSVPMIRNFGIVFCVGLVLACIADLALLPALLSLAGRSDRRNQCNLLKSVPNDATET